MGDQAVPLNDRIIGSFAVGKVFKDHAKQVNSMDFSVDGM